MGLLAAVAFLTRIPMPKRAHEREFIPAAVPWFPVVGAGIGAAVGGAARIGALAGLPPLAAAAAGAAAGLALTGALHEDGLADSFDGLGGGRSRQRMLEIMADPRLGAFGTSALVVSILLQVSALAALAVLPGAAVVTAAAAATPPAGHGRRWPSRSPASPAPPPTAWLPCTDRTPAPGNAPSASPPAWSSQASCCGRTRGSSCLPERRGR